MPIDRRHRYPHVRRGRPDDRSVRRLFAVRARLAQRRPRRHRDRNFLLRRAGRTGEYDYSCSPEDTQETAVGIAGAKVRIMKKLGHFPMSENPPAFVEELLPVLDEIAAAR